MDVSAWLKNLGLGQYEAAFRDNAIDGDLLPSLTAENLRDLGVTIVGHIDRGLPSLGLPDVSFHDYVTLLGGGIGVMLVGFAEGLGAAKTYAAKHHYDIDVNHELVGLGTGSTVAHLLPALAARRLAIADRIA